MSQLPMRHPLRPSAALLPLILVLSACQPAPPAEDPMPTTDAAEQMVHILDVERAYTLEDDRDLDFRARIADQAAAYCDGADHIIQSIQPYGPERFDNQFIYRMVRVGITCAS